MGNSPLIYVDGVRVYGGNTPTNVGGRQFSSPLNDIAAESAGAVMGLLAHALAAPRLRGWATSGMPGPRLPSRPPSRTRPPG